MTTADPGPGPGENRELADFATEMQAAGYSIWAARLRALAATTGETGRELARICYWFATFASGLRDAGHGDAATEVEHQVGRLRALAAPSPRITRQAVIGAVDGVIGPDTNTGALVADRLGLTEEGSCATCDWPRGETEPVACPECGR